MDEPLSTPSKINPRIAAILSAELVMRISAPEELVEALDRMGKTLDDNDYHVAAAFVRDHLRLRQGKLSQQ